MNGKNHTAQALALTVLVCVGMLAVSAVGEFSLWGLAIKKIDILSDVRSGNQVTAAARDVRGRNARSTGAVAVKDGLPGALESAGRRPDQEGLEAVRSTGAEGLKTGETPHNINGQNMAHFFESLRLLKSSAFDGKVRIAYYGDSQIEGDLITQDFRELFQREFGGKGFGFVPITSQDAPFRLQLKHTFSGGWRAVSIKENPKTACGISGAVFMPRDNSWLKYEVMQPLRFRELRLFYDNAGEGYRVRYRIDGQPEESLLLASGEELQEVRLDPQQEMKSVKFMLPKDPIHLYGVSLENGKGIYIDSFPLRGHSGLGLAKIPRANLRKFDEHLNYKLIVLHFGVNVASPGVVNYTWYEQGMVKVINHLKEAFPESSFLLVSVGDRSTKTEGRYGTDRSIPKLLEAQRRIADKTNIAFFNLYEAMGGTDAMVSWVEKGLAAKDYIHFSRSGGRRVAQTLYDELVQKYAVYEAGRTRAKSGG